MITIDWDQKLYMLSFIQTFNRYGPWMDTNLVLPLGPRRCQVVFDYFLEASLKRELGLAASPFSSQLYSSLA
ncbi:hypothetical protein RGQ29_025954 [Quercus rubra]|uniref:Uncharacterized protein n=1 Tax=Quercus rubra TaxID=3512 RepID=A0AAN7F113_QUERU|nr:hypothetical protein RGQ29_025954 [Quercus rubra]KAK4582995.1 hypothetical protein RGQ29_025954 [Quercus rubra]